MAALAFVDTETTHLDPRFGDVWEVAVIRREHGVETEYLWQVRPDLTTADPESLKIGRYEERFAVPPNWRAAAMPTTGLLGPPFGLSLPEFLFDLQTALGKSVLIGSNPGFDDAFLKKLLHRNRRKIGWHYRPKDIATLAEGYLRATNPGWFDEHSEAYSSRDLSRAVGVEPPGDDVAHTALGDAKWAAAVFDAVTGARQAAERAA